MFSEIGYTVVDLKLSCVCTWKTMSTKWYVLCTLQKRTNERMQWQGTDNLIWNQKFVALNAIIPLIRGLQANYFRCVMTKGKVNLAGG